MANLKNEQQGGKPNSKNNQSSTWLILLAGFLAGIVLVCVTLAVGNTSGWWNFNSLVGRWGYSNQLPYYPGVMNQMMGSGNWDDFDQQMLRVQNDVNRIQDYNDVMMNDFINSSKSGVVFNSSVSQDSASGQGKVSFSLNGKAVDLSYTKDQDGHLQIDLSKFKAALAADPKAKFDLAFLDSKGKVIQEYQQIAMIKDDNLTVTSPDKNPVTIKLTVTSGDGTVFTLTQTI